MKGYIALFVTVALVLLLIPLPALPRRASDTTPPTDSSVPPPGSSVPAADEATFRILAGGTVVTLTEREFLIRTLAFEMPAAYHSEALKAQAVAAYTYYGRQRLLRQKAPDPALQGGGFCHTGREISGAV